MTDDLPTPSAGSLLRIGSPRVKVYTADQMREFATIAVLAEREACAKVCDQMEQEAEGTECCKWPTPADCAHAIRARGQA
jgi:hypothetical protein